jgi:endonuclease/exonuclease/phosphatase family metal-dependent hydrolase
MKFKKTIAGLALAAVIALGCYASQQKDVLKFSGSPTVATLEDYVTIATWNIQTFGQSKLNKSDVMEYIARAILENKVDVLAIQEIRSKEQNVMPALVDLLNKSGAKYDFVISRRLGRTSSMEQYAFLYNTQNITYINDSAYIISDSTDQIHREPLVANFKANNGTFDFTLINIHTDPDETEKELNFLDNVYVSVQKSDTDENDVIILGDFNQQGSRMGELGKVPGMIILLADLAVKTNTRNTMQYDNIMFDDNTKEYLGWYNVFNYQQAFGITLEKALEISDHRPVIARFSKEGND